VYLKMLVLLRELMVAEIYSC